MRNAVFRLLIVPLICMSLLQMPALATQRNSTYDIGIPNETTDSLSHDADYDDEPLCQDFTDITFEESAALLGDDAEYLWVEPIGNDNAYLAAASTAADVLVDYLNSRVGEYYKPGYCQAFVWYSINHCFGADNTDVICCATKGWQVYGVSSSRDNIPVGAAVYFGGSGKTDSYCGQNAGHVGLHVGNGEIVHVWSRGEIKKTSIDYVLNCGYTYNGWGWQANYPLDGEHIHRIVRYGSSGVCVRELQEALNRLINAGLEVDGSFGPNVLAALKQYQTSRGLEVDGVCGPATWSKIESDSPDQPQNHSHDVVRRGSNGRCVVELQEILNFLINAGLEVDGNCGPATVAAIKNYQSQKGLAVDGSCGPATWRTIDDDFCIKNPWLSANKDTFEPGEEIRFTYGADYADSYYIWVEKDGDGTKVAQDVSAGGYTTSFSEPGHYTAHVSCYTSRAFTYYVLLAESSNFVSFDVRENIRTPENPRMSVNKERVAPGEEITFSYGADNATTYWIGIDRDGSRIITQEVPASSYTTSFSEPGQYSAYVSCSNAAGYIGRAYFNVEIPQYFLDVNGWLDGSEIYDLSDYGTVNVRINGTVVSNDTNDYYSQHPIGTSYAIENIVPKSGFSYNGIRSGAREGTIGNGDTIIQLDFSRIQTGGIDQGGETSYNGNRYVYYSTPVTWYTARQFCEEQGGHLVTVTTADENAVVQNLAGNGNAWMGGTDQGGQPWRWVTGEPFNDIGKWGTNEPNNDSSNDEGEENYLHICADGIWNDNAGYRNLPFVCEFEGGATYTVTLDPNGGTLPEGTGNTISVQYGGHYGNLPTAIRDGYTNTGWYNADGVDVTGESTVTVAADHTIYARWEVYIAPPSPDEPQIVIENRTAEPGSTISIPVLLKNNPGLVSFRFRVEYDTSKLELIRLEDADYSLVGLKGTSSPVIFNYTDATNGDKTAVKAGNLIFNVRDYSAGEAAFNIDVIDSEDFYNTSGEIIPFKVSTGTLTIRDSQPGDVNGDGKVNNRDVGVLQQYLSGWSVIIQEKAADANGDRKVNNRDVGVLQQFLSGWDITLGAS